MVICRSPPDLAKMMAQAQQMQTRMAELQQSLARKSFEGTAGGGMVKAVASGDLRVKRIEIEAELFAGGDRQMIQDLAAAAVNDALANAQRGVQDALQRLTASMPGAGGPS